METPAVIHADDGDYCLATWDRTLIMIWRRASKESAVTKACALGRTFAAKHGDKITVLVIVEPESEIPGSEARAEFARFARETGTKAACCVVVPEGGGFRSALVRSIFGGIGALLRQAFPFKFAESIDAALKLLEPHFSPAAGGAEALRRALGKMRATLRPANAK